MISTAFALQVALDDQATHPAIRGRLQHLYLDRAGDRLGRPDYDAELLSGQRLALARAIGLTEAVP